MIGMREVSIIFYHFEMSKELLNVALSFREPCLTSSMPDSSGLAHFQVNSVMISWTYIN